MSDVAATDAGTAPPRLLAPVTVAVLLAIGVASFVAMLLVGAYAPDLGRGGKAGGHALSNASIGFSGIVRLAAATGRGGRIARDVRLLDTQDLVVATPEAASVPVDPALNPRTGLPTLIVLPKWQTQPDRDNNAWVDVAGLLPASEPQGVLAPANNLTVVRHPSGGRPLRTVAPLLAGVTFDAPRPLQAIRPSASANGTFGSLQPLVVDDHGNIVVGRFTDRPLYVLADPDLLDNRGMRRAATAKAALAMLGRMNGAGGDGIAFDVTLNGYGHGASPLKLIFEPPFVAMTLTLATAVVLAALGMVARFGSATPRGRAIAFGKAALVDNTAALVRKAGREARLGRRYAEVIREVATRAFGVPARLRGTALDEYLDRIGRGARFTTLADAVVRADNKDDLTRAARRLHDWLEGRET